MAVPSGRSEIFSIPQSSKVGDLRVLAQKSFQLGFLRLVAADHSVVDPTKSLQAAGLEDGAYLTAIAVEAKVAATGQAFALFCFGGDQVVTWGESLHGGDSAEVQDQLKGVQQVHAAILGNGSAVTWGASPYDGDSSQVQHLLKDVQQLLSTKYALGAILADGSVVTWGDDIEGADSSEVKDQLEGVQRVQATWGAFAARMWRVDQLLHGAIQILVATAVQLQTSLDMCSQIFLQSCPPIQKPTVSKVPAETCCKSLSDSTYPCQFSMAMENGPFADDL